MSKYVSWKFWKLQGLAEKFSNIIGTFTDAYQKLMRQSDKKISKNSKRVEEHTTQTYLKGPHRTNSYKGGMMLFSSVYRILTDTHPTQGGKEQLICQGTIFT